MTYVLVYCPAMGIFALEGPDAIRLPLTELELRGRFNGDPSLNAWADYAKANPDRPVAYDMLPR